MKNYKELFTNGIVRENPLLAPMNGLCSGLAITTSVANGIGMGLAMTFVLLMSELIISLFRRMILQAVRIPIFIVVIASFTTIVDLVMKAFLPELSGSLGVFIPLIVVNCIIMGRVESFASKQPLDRVVFDSLGMGLGYAWVLVGISAVRELLGAGTLLGFRLIPESYSMGFFAKSPGGFFVFGMFIAVNMMLKKRFERGGSAQ